MNVLRTLLIDAIAEGISTEHGEVSARMISSLPPGDCLCRQQAAWVIAATVAGLHPTNAIEQMSCFPLAGALLTQGGHSEWLEPEAARATKGLGWWIADNLPGQIAQMLWRSPTLFGLIAPTPRIKAICTVQIADRVETIVVEVDRPESDVAVSLHFGHRLPSANHRIFRELCGTAFHAIAEQALPYPVSFAALTGERTRAPY